MSLPLPHPRGTPWPIVLKNDFIGEMREKSRFFAPRPIFRVSSSLGLPLTSPGEDPPFPRAKRHFFKVKKPKIVRVPDQRCDEDSKKTRHFFGPKNAIFDPKLLFF